MDSCMQATLSLSLSLSLSLAQLLLLLLQAQAGNNRMVHQVLLSNTLLRAPDA
jgi:hypothetical protein